MSRRLFLSAAAVLAALPGLALAAGFVSDRITVRVSGSGPDVVLIPGMNSSPRAWASTVAAVPGYRYHIVQVSGFGGQPAGANRSGDVSAPVAEEIARYIRESGLRRPAVAGHSMGGTIALMLAARHPDALSRLMVVDMFPFLGLMFGGPNATPASLQTVADGAAARLRDIAPEDRSKRATETIAGMVNTASYRPGAVEDALASDADVTARSYRELVLTDLRPELARIKVPTTVLYVLPKGVPLTAQQLDAFYQGAYANLKGVVLKRVPDSAHFIMWDQPGRFQAEFKAFLSAK